LGMVLLIINNLSWGSSYQMYRFQNVEMRIAKQEKTIKHKILGYDCENFDPVKLLFECWAVCFKSEFQN
jgi:hypothetical protein